MADRGNSIEEALTALAVNEQEDLSFLKNLCRIPSVSREKPPHPPMKQAAGLLVEALRGIGFAGARIVEAEGAHPYVAAEWLERPGSPTVLLYGHYDVVPPGRAEVWASSPWEVVERDGRLRARGVADDKGGLSAMLAALGAWSRTSGAFPVNIRVLIDGEEEIGSPAFGKLLEAHAELVACETAIVCDGGNFDVGLPTLTIRTRGVLAIEVTVKALERPAHSGLFGGAVPDAAMTLASIVGRLVDDDGHIAVPGFLDDVIPVEESETARFASIDGSRLVREAGLVKGAAPWGESGYGFLERLWARPSLTVTVLEGRALKDVTAAYMDKAVARISIRTVPDMDARRVGRTIVDHILSMNPRGAIVEARVVGEAPWWRVDPDSPAVGAALRAFRRGYDREPILAGDGASIGILAPLTKQLGGKPCLVFGVEEPGCGAHAENEGLLLGEWRSTARSIVVMLSELACLS